jgi:hypothetical protein
MERIDGGGCGNTKSTRDWQSRHISLPGRRQLLTTFATKEDVGHEWKCKELLMGTLSIRPV